MRIKQTSIKIKGMLHAKKVSTHITQFIIRKTLPSLILDCHVIAVWDTKSCTLVCFIFSKECSLALFGAEITHLIQRDSDVGIHVILHQQIG